MKLSIKTLVLGAFLSLPAVSAIAGDCITQQAEAQHYVFTYDYENTVDPLFYITREMEQDLHHSLVLDIQQQTNNNLLSILSDDSMQSVGLLAATRTAEHPNIAE